jgi:hypothetical protein
MEVFSEDYIRNTYSCKTKVSLLTSIINIYCSTTYLNRNLWLLEKVAETLHEIENSSHKSSVIISLVCKLVTYISKIPKREFIVPFENLQYLLYSTISAHSQLTFMRDLVTEEGFSFFNVLFTNVRDSQDLQQSLAIVKNILTQNTSRTKELDPYDCMFVFLLQLPTILELDNKINKYVTSCKDIFYYRLRKKDKPNRVNLIYFAVYVLLTRHVSYKALAGQSTHDYLFITPRIDLKKAHSTEGPKQSFHNQETKKIVLENMSYGAQGLEIVLNNSSSK